MRRATRLFAWLFVTACAGETPPAKDAAGANPPPNPTAAASAATPSADAHEADAAVAEALAQVVRVRKLGALRPVTSHVIERAELSERVKRDVLTELEPAQVQGITESLVAFGVVPVDLDYEKTVLELLGSQIAGYYDPREKAMFLLDDLGEDAQAATLWHELVHAIQDQHYDLHPKLKWAEGRGDATAAVQALAEGDATSAMLDVMLGPQGQTALDLPEGAFARGIGMVEALPEIASVPAIMKRSIVAPYTDGLVFVHALRKKGGWAAVDQAWRDPPTTTEQILHPEKYLAREGAKPVPAPPAPHNGPTDRVYLDQLGEQGLRLLFEEWMPLGTAAQSASGWGGDQIAVFATGDQRAMAVRLTFDDDPSAKRALEGFARGALLGEPEDRKGAEGRVSAEKAAAASAGGRLCRERARRGPMAVVRVGRDVTVTLGPFRRQGGGLASVGTCKSALQWADAVASAGRQNP